MRTLSRQA